jgi:chaperonin GroEL
MQKISIVGVEARDKALKGATYVAEAVKSTLGPFGLNAMIEKGNRITNDGFTVSREIVPTIKDEIERRGAYILHEISSKTNDQVGDATTSSETLALAIIHEAIRFLPKTGGFGSKKTPSEMLKMIKDSKDEVIKKLSGMVKTIETKEELINSAKVSVEDDELAQLIGSTQWDLGPDGFILSEETAETKCSIQRVKGIRIDNGFGTSVLINNPEKQSLELQDVSVILTNHTLSDLNPIKGIIDQLIKLKKNKIVIVARGFTSECIQVCLKNHESGVFFYPISAPYTNQAEVMRDMAAALGGRYIDQEEGQLEDMNLSDVAFASKVVARRYDAIFTGADDDKTKQRVSERVDRLQKSLEGEVSEFEKKSLQARISQLTNGFAILKVGASNETERKYKKDKCDDAVNAVRLALQGGTVKGAGLAFKEISETLEDGNILKKPLLAINQQIMSSAPVDFVVEDWVRDPFLVLKAALENACSGAGIFATTNVVVANKNPLECKCGNNNNQENEN